MSDFASLNGVRIATASILVPLYGAWAGDVQLTGTDTVPTAVTLTLGDLTLKGAVYRQAAFAGTRRLRIIGGAGGWPKPVTPRHYQHSFGVTRAMVIGDAAREVGETANVPVDVSLGADFVRSRPGGGAMLAVDVLRLVGGPVWHIDEAGVTQVSAWPTKSVAGSFQVIDQRPDEGRVTIATETYATWLPGGTFASPYTEGTLQNAGARFSLDAEGVFRLDVFTVPA